MRQKKKSRRPTFCILYFILYFLINMEKTKIDYLDEDEPIRHQNYVCLSFLNPEDTIIKNK